MRLVLESNGNLDCNMYDLEKEVLGRDILLLWMPWFMRPNAHDIPRVGLA